MLNIPQEILNKLSSQHEPRTKQKSVKRLLREQQYQSSNKEIMAINANLEPLNEDLEPLK